MKEKKIPLRRCVVTNEFLPKKELMRIVKNKDGKIFLDETSRANGHGAYLKKSEEIVLEAKKRKVLNRIFACELPDELYKEMLEFVRKN